MSPDDLAVSGPATAEDVAAILAALQRRNKPDDVTDDRYEQWRRARLAVLRDNR